MQQRKQTEPADVSLVVHTANGDGIDREPTLPPEKVLPGFNLVLIVPIVRTQSKGGVLIPETAQGGEWDETPQALVVSTGPDVKQYKRGQRVVIPASTQAWKVQVDGVRMLCLLDERIVGTVIEPEEVVQARLRPELEASKDE